MAGSSQVLRVIGFTVLAISIMLYIYYRSKRAVLVPLLSAAASAVWGLGFMSLVGFSLDPLILVLPFLIALMTARHSIQLVARYMEEFEKTAKQKIAEKGPDFVSRFTSSQRKTGIFLVGAVFI